MFVAESKPPARISSSASVAELRSLAAIAS